jgi:hypothetical protein
MIIEKWTLTLQSTILTARCTNHSIKGHHGNVLTQRNLSSCKVSVVFVRLETKLDFPDKSFVKLISTKLHKNQSRLSLILRYGRTDRRTYISKIILSCHYFANIIKT